MKIAVFVTWDDVSHIPESQKAALLASIPPWQRDSRTKGVPQLGAGAIYQIPESEITTAAFPIPKHFVKCYGLDVGWNRTAAIFGAHDRDTGTTYIYDEYYRGQAEPSVHAAAIKMRGKWIPGVIDPAARGRQQADGKQLLDLYQKLDLDVEIAENAREAGIYKVWEGLSQGSIKIFKNCVNTLSEYRLYRRDEKGQIVKKNDHLMDALRYLIMSGLERAKSEPTGRSDGMPWHHVNIFPVWTG